MNHITTTQARIYGAITLAPGRIADVYPRPTPGTLWEFDGEGDVALSGNINGLSGEGFERDGTTLTIQPTDAALTAEDNWELDINDDLQPEDI